MANGGIIGPTNVTSRGKNKVTTKTASAPCSALTTQPGTRLAQMLLVAGGGAGGGDGAGGGGAGGVPMSTNPCTRWISFRSLNYWRRCCRNKSRM